MTENNKTGDNIETTTKEDFVEVSSIEIDLLNKKKQLIEQTQRVNEVNTENKAKISNLETSIQDLNEKLEKVLDIEQDVKTLIDNHKKTLQNPEKTSQNVAKLESEIVEIQDRIENVKQNCIDSIDQYTAYLNRFL